MKRAWRTHLLGIASIVAAESPAQAKYRTLRSAREAGFDAEYVMVRCHRAPEYDEWASHNLSGHPWDEAFLCKLTPTPAPEVKP